MIVLAGQHLIVRHALAEMADFVAGLANRNVFGRDRKAIVHPAAPLTRDRITVIPVCDPVIVCNDFGRRADQARARDKPSEAFEHTLTLQPDCLDAAFRLARRESAQAAARRGLVWPLRHHGPGRAARLGQPVAKL